MMTKSSTRTSDSSSAASFRDPNGFMFQRSGKLYRQINKIYQENYDLLIDSGLYEALTSKKWLIPHQEVQVTPAEPAHAYKVIQPEKIDFISYPYEWSFSQLKDAALTTLAIQKRAMTKGMALKDSSAYNIQFHKGRPLLIDTLSFEAYREGEPWVAYRQFCQHFLAPLALMAYTDVRLSQLLRVYIDGVPLDLASRLLPRRTRFNLGLYTHIHLHAKMQASHAARAEPIKRQSTGMGRTAFIGLIDNLRSIIRKLTWQPAGTEWGEYYEADSGHYSEPAAQHKRSLISQFLDRMQPQAVWDLGANTGVYSRIASQREIPTVSFDIDPAAVEQNYLTCKNSKETHLLPLVLDLTNPSPPIGWDNMERISLQERGPVDAILALALIHHLAISNNVPLARIAEFLHKLGNWLVIEFIPKSDSQVQILLSSREDIFPDYTLEGFVTAFSKFFTIQESINIDDTERSLHLMKKKD